MPIGNHGSRQPLGTFKSSPIHASTFTEAREILGRTYRAERWTLKRCQKFDFGEIRFGARYAWTFYVIPKSH
jgi:hypothetical protein